MLIVWIGIVFALILLIAIVDFVLVNETMFKAPFDIIFRVPFSEWKYTLEDVQFIYLIAGSVLFGALIIAISTFVLDAKRKLKLRSLRKELKVLQRSIEEAKAALPEEKSQEQAVEENPMPSGSVDEASATPEDITKSFEDAVESGDFLSTPPEEAVKSTQQEETAERQDQERETDKQLPQATAVEAELVEAEDDAVPEDPSAKKEREQSEETS